MWQGIDLAILAVAEAMPDHATPPARMSGGDRTDTDMSKWGDLTVLDNPFYRSADEGEVSGWCGSGAPKWLVEMLEQSIGYARRCVEDCGGNAAWIAVFLVAFERLERLMRWSPIPDLEPLGVARELVLKHGSLLGREAAKALVDLPPLPLEECDPGVVEAELLEVLNAAEYQALLVEHMPLEDAALAQGRLGQLVESVESEPWRFSSLAKRASEHIVDWMIPPTDPRWMVWSAVARTARDG